MNRRTRFFALAAVAVSVTAAGWATRQQAANPEILVYKSASCGCCGKWVEHLEAHGFAVTAVDMDDLGPIRREHGITRALSSCHTAVVEGYVVEGHVPAETIARLLEERPAVKGVAVPGMPIGSPGMEGPNPEPYDVLAFDAEGRTTVFASH